MTDSASLPMVPPALALQLSTLAQQTVLLVIGSDGVGPFNLMIEVSAIAQFLEQAKPHYTTPLVQSVVDILLPKTSKDSHKNDTSTTVDMKQVDSASVLNQVGDLDNLIADEADRAEFKQFLLDFANKVARAAGPGLFGSGKKVSAKEAAFLAELQGRLGLQPR